MAQPNAWFRSSLLQKRAGLQNILKSRIGKWSRRNLCFFFTEDEVKNIKRKARKIIPERIGYWAEKIGVTYGRIAIRLQSSRWGSCAAKLIKPVFDEFHEWLLEIKPKVPPTLMFGRAINYALSAWNHLLNYLDCLELFVDNSIAERSIKPFVIGRKNWLFSGSETGAENSCFLFTLIENAKLYKLDPYEYLRCIFDQAPFCESEKDFEKLLP